VKEGDDVFKALMGPPPRDYFMERRERWHAIRDSLSGWTVYVLLQDKKLDEECECKVDQPHFQFESVTLAELILHEAKGTPILRLGKPIDEKNIGWYANGTCYSRVIHCKKQAERDGQNGCTGAQITWHKKKIKVKNVVSYGDLFL